MWVKVLKACLALAGLSSASVAPLMVQVEKVNPEGGGIDKDKIDSPERLIAHQQKTPKKDLRKEVRDTKLPQGSLGIRKKLQEISSEAFEETPSPEDSGRSHDISYLNFVSNFHKILGSDIRVDNETKKPWIEKVEVLSPVPDLFLEGLEKFKVDESKYSYSIAFDQKKGMQNLFSHFFSQNWTVQEELSLSSSISIVDTEFDAIGNENKTELIFHRRDKGNTYYLSIEFNVSVSHNRIDLGEKSLSVSSAEIDREFSKLFLNLSENTDKLYKWIHIIAKCIKGGKLEDTAANSFYEYYQEHERRQELCSIISKLTRKSNSCLILS